MRDLYEPLQPNELSALMSDRPKPNNSVSDEDIRSRISAIYFTVLCGQNGESRKTICTIKLDNGWEIDGESVVIDPANFNYHLGKHFSYLQAFGKLKQPFSLLWMEDHFNDTKCIRLSDAEIQSGLDRVKFAEGLILQLPHNHEGRNTWLMNYGSWQTQYKITSGEDGKWCFFPPGVKVATKDYDTEELAFRAAFDSYLSSISAPTPARKIQTLSEMEAENPDVFKNPE